MFNGKSADEVLRLVRMQGLSEAYEILRAHANDASAGAVNIRDECERDRQNER